MRPLSSLSTVPTCTPSAPITSICSSISIFPSFRGQTKGPRRTEGLHQGVHPPSALLLASFLSGEALCLQPFEVGTEGIIRLLLLEQILLGIQTALLLL